jgi:tetratricopeptide (TPR) repeat protein
MLEGFDFGSPGIANQLTGSLAPLKKYNALRVPADFFDEAMDRLRSKFLHVPLEMVLHPASVSAGQAARKEQVGASAAAAVKANELTAQEWFELGFNATDLDEQLEAYTQAIRLKPDYAMAWNNRGAVRLNKGDFEGAIKDCTEALRCKPNLALAFHNRGNAYCEMGELESAQ